MECKHPVLYHVNGVLTCHICGATFEQDKQTATEEKPVETPKKAAKRRAKKEGAAE